MVKPVLWGCKPNLFALPVLTHLNVRCAPVLKSFDFRHHTPGLNYRGVVAWGQQTIKKLY
jgi:hypothetical protein